MKSRRFRHDLGRVYLPRIVMLLLMVATRVSRSDEPAANTGAFRVMTFNIRYDNPADGENRWLRRRDDVAKLIHDCNVDVVGVQEALKHQLDDLAERLPEFAWYGVGREDGKQRGEYCPVLFRRSRFRAVDKATIWLSETPTVPGSKSWDSSLPRIVTQVTFDDSVTGRRMILMNTHFDHQGVEARANSARILDARRREFRANGYDLVLMGDFNCRDQDLPYAILTGKSTSDERNAAADHAWRDTRAESSSPPVGPNSTWNGFERIVAGQRIDFVFIDGEFDVLAHETVDQTIDGRFYSDHLPVIATLRFAGKSKSSAASAETP